MKLALTRDAEQFAAVARPFLSERIECNVMVTVLINVLGGMLASPPRLFAYGLDDNGEVRFAALRTRLGTCWRASLT